MQICSTLCLSYAFHNHRQRAAWPQREQCLRLDGVIRRVAQPEALHNSGEDQLRLDQREPFADVLARPAAEREVGVVWPTSRSIWRESFGFELFGVLSACTSESRLKSLTSNLTIPFSQPHAHELGLHGGVDHAQ